MTLVGSLEDQNADRNADNEALAHGFWRGVRVLLEIELEAICAMFSKSYVFCHVLKVLSETEFKHNESVY